MASSSSFSGTILSSPSAAAWTTIVERCENALNDAANAEWTTAEIALFINDGVGDYSQHFPLVKTQSISCSADDHTYDLAADFLGVLSVEYPAGEDPPQYLSRLAHTHPDFWSGSRWYDIALHKNDTDPDQLWISNDPAAGESINVIYNARHAEIGDPTSISGNATIPAVHHHLLVKFVLWQATVQLLFAEQQSPTSSSSLLMAQLSQNARRLESAYHTAVRQALYAAEGESGLASWVRGGDFHARIY